MGCIKYGIFGGVWIFSQKREIITQQAELKFQFKSVHCCVRRECRILFFFCPWLSGLYFWLKSEISFSKSKNLSEHALHTPNHTLVLNLKPNTINMFLEMKLQINLKREGKILQSLKGHWLVFYISNDDAPTTILELTHTGLNPVKLIIFLFNNVIYLYWLHQFYNIYIYIQKFSPRTFLWK